VSLALFDLTLPVLLLVWGITAGAALLRAFTGFGFALVAVPAYALFFAPGEAVVLCSSLVVILGVQTFPVYRHAMDLRQRWPLFAAALPGTVFGALMLRWLDPQQFRLSLGVLTILASLLLARFRPSRTAASPQLAGMVGLASGFCNGAFAVPGPPVIVYVMATESDPARSRGLMIGFFSFSGLLALCSFFVLGFVSQRTLLLALLAYPAMYAGDRLGYLAFLRYGARQYRPVAIALCLAIGVAITLRALAG
jgi:uncharacterized membrane protein YfcA